MNDPLDMDRPFAASHASVVPLMVVLQFCAPSINVARDCTTGATADTSGQLSLLANPRASVIVNVLALAAPPDTPPDDVLPGEIVRRFVPSDAIRAFTESAEAWPMPTVQMTAAMPYRMPSVVRTERSRWPVSPRRPVATVY